MKKNEPSAATNAARPNGPLILKGSTPGGNHFIAALGKRDAKGDAHLKEIKKTIEKHIPQKK
jgi:hypothetical protein